MTRLPALRRKVGVLLFIVMPFISPANPILSFFNEMKGLRLQELFKDSTLIPTLQQLHAEVRMGILDLTAERATVIKRLNQAGIPVVAWLLLPPEKGYWFNSRNGQQAIERYQEIKQWADQEGLLFKGIGIDLELDINDANLIRSHPWKLLMKLPPRLYDKSVIKEGQEVYAKLIALIKKDGYPLESYYASFIKDETANGTTSIQQLSRFLDVKVEKEIPMLYSSFMGNPDGLIKVYGIDIHAQAIALGSTGGGVDTTLPVLSWDQLAHDIRLASSTATEIHIFSLEGCVEHGYLQRLVGFDYSVPVPIQPQQVEAIKKLQKNVIRASDILSHPNLLFGSLLLILVLVGWLLYVLIKKIYRMFMGNRSAT